MIEQLLFIVVVPVLIGLGMACVAFFLNVRLESLQRDRPHVARMLGPIFLLLAAGVFFLALMLPKIRLEFESFPITLRYPSFAIKKTPIIIHQQGVPLLLSIWYALCTSFVALSHLSRAVPSGAEREQWFMRVADMSRPVEVLLLASGSVAGYKIISSLALFRTPRITALFIMIAIQYSIAIAAVSLGAYAPSRRRQAAVRAVAGVPLMTVVLVLILWI